MPTRAQTIAEIDLEKVKRTADSRGIDFEKMKGVIVGSDASELLTMLNQTSDEHDSIGEAHKAFSEAPMYSAEEYIAGVDLLRLCHTEDQGFVVQAYWNEIHENEGPMKYRKLVKLVYLKLATIFDELDEPPK